VPGAFDTLAAVSGLLGSNRVVQARLGRRTSNALELVFRAGPGDPLAVATQNGGGGTGAKFGTLLGFKNGGPGTHSLVSQDGSRGGLVATATGPKTVVTGDGEAPFGVIERVDDATTLRGPGDRVLATLAGDPTGVVTLEAFRLLVSSPTGAPLGRLQVARTVAGWSLVDDIIDTTIWWGKAAPLKLPVLGASLQLDTEVDADLGDMLLAACVDLCIGLRAYVAGMR
jgi:hypothetical protein